MSDSPHSPFRLRGEGLRLVIACGGGDDLIPVLVDGARLRGRQLRLLFGLLLDLSNLLPLLGWGRDLHSQNDIPDLRLGQRCYIHTVE